MENKEQFNRCVLIMNEEITGGYLANAIAVIALTVGKRHPYLAGAPLIDASGFEHPGLIPTGIPMLQTSGEKLKELRIQALEKGFDVVDFSKEGQQTKDYEEYLSMMSMIKTENVEYLGIAIIGTKNGVSKLTKHIDMIR